MAVQGVGASTAPKPAAKVVVTPRSSAMPPPAKTNTPPAQPFPGYMTPAQQVAQASALADASLLPQRQAYKDAAAQDQAIAAAQQKATQGYYEALAGILKDAGAGVQGGYQQAAGNDAAFSKGFSDGLSHVQSVMGAQNQGVLNVAGAPAGQAANVAQATGGSGVTDALYNATGYQPALNLAGNDLMGGQGAAAGAAATVGVPTAIGGQGGQAVTRIGLQELQNQNTFASKIAALSAQLPQLRQQYGSQLASQQNTLADNARADAQYKQAETDRRQKITDTENQNTINNAIKQAALFGTDAKGNLTLSARDKIAKLQGVDPATGLPTVQALHYAATEAAATTRNNTAIEALNARNAPKYSAPVSKSLGYSADQYGIPIGGKVRLLPGFGYDKTGNIVKVSTSGTTRTHGFTAPALAKIKGTALTFAENAALGGEYDKNGKVVPPGDPSGGYAYDKSTKKYVPAPPLSREAALEKTRQLGIPDWVALPALNTYYGPPKVAKAASKFFAGTGLGFNSLTGNG